VEETSRARLVHVNLEPRSRPGLFLMLAEGRGDEALNSPRSLTYREGAAREPWAAMRSKPSWGYWGAPHHPSLPLGLA
jgi:hypothetical protein